MIGLLAAHHIGLVQILMICVPSTLIAVFVASLVTKAPVAEVPRCKTCQSGVTAIVGILGLAWLGDTFINANREAIIGGLSTMATAAPWTFAFGLFFASVLLYSQAATARALMPLGLSRDPGRKPVPRSEQKENVFTSDFLTDFDIGAVECADGGRAVKCELHITRIRCRHGTPHIYPAASLAKLRYVFSVIERTSIKWYHEIFRKYAEGVRGLKPRVKRSGTLGTEDEYRPL